MSTMNIQNVNYDVNHLIWVNINGSKSEKIRNLSLIYDSFLHLL